MKKKEFNCNNKCVLSYLQFSQFINVNLFQLVLPIFIQPVFCVLQFQRECITILDVAQKVRFNSPSTLYAFLAIFRLVIVFQVSKLFLLCCSTLIVHVNKSLSLITGWAGEAVSLRLRSFTDKLNPIHII